MYSPTFVSDSLVNLVSGLGTPKDKATQARFVARAKLSRGEIDTIYATNWLGKKAVDLLPDNCCREWRQWNGTKSAIQALEDEERRLRYRDKVNLALKLAMKDGGAAVVIGAGGDPAVPLDVNTVPKGGLKFIHVMSRWELSVAQVDRDPMSPYFGQAAEYQIYNPRSGYTAIHPSRVIPFMGVPRADRGELEDPWGDSIYESLYDPIRDATSSLQVAGTLLQEAKIDVIKIPGLSENVGRQEYRNAVIQRFGLAMAMKSLNNTLILDALEEWEQKTLTFQGIPEIVERLLQVVAGSLNTPVTILLGQSPAGLNATGKADLEAFYTQTKSIQENRIRPTIEALDAALIRSATGRTAPRGLFYEWRSLWSPSAVDLADLNVKHAQAIEAYSRAGVFTPEALQAGVLSQLSEDNFLSGIEAAVQVNPGAPGNIQLQSQQIAAEAAVAKAQAAAKAKPASGRNPQPTPTR